MDGLTSVSGSGKATRDVRLVFMMPTFHQSPFTILDRSLPCCNFRLPMLDQCVVRNRPVLLTSVWERGQAGWLVEHAPCYKVSRFHVAEGATVPACQAPTALVLRFWQSCFIYLPATVPNARRSAPPLCRPISEGSRLFSTGPPSRAAAG